MRSTKASAAIDRLKRRSGNAHYSMTLGGGGMFCLMLSNDIDVSKQGVSQQVMSEQVKSRRLCEPMPIDEFNAFVNAYQAPTPKRVSKLEVAFQKQLTKK